MTARTPRTTREEREGLREAASLCAAYWPGPWVVDGEAVYDACASPVAVVSAPEALPYVATADPERVEALVSDLFDAEADLAAAVKRAERAEAAVGRVREAAAEVTRHYTAPGPAPEPLDAINVLARVVFALHGPGATAALDAATDAETGRGGAGRSQEHSGATDGLEVAQIGENEGEHL